MSRVRDHLTTALIAAAVASAMTAAPAVAGRIADYARNSDKVDGHHAVGSWASPNRRAGAVVATDSQGRLPNGIIRRAPDSKRLQGLAANDLARAAFSDATRSIQNFADGRFESVHGKRVWAPVDGMLLTWGQVTVERDADSAAGTGAGVAARLTLDGRQTGRTLFSEVTSAGRFDSSVVQVMSMSPVEAGSHQLSLDVRRTYGSARISLRGRGVRSLFVPFGNDGTRAGG